MDEQLKIRELLAQARAERLANQQFSKSIAGLELAQYKVRRHFDDVNLDL